MLSNFNFSLEERILYSKLIKSIALVCSIIWFLITEKRVNKISYKASILIYAEAMFISLVGSKFVSFIEYFILNSYSTIGFIENNGARNSGFYFFLFLYLIFKEKTFKLSSNINLFISSLIGLFVIGKWSCFIIGDTCHGINTNSFVGTTIKGISTSTIGVHPVTIYDSIFYLIFLIIIVNISDKIDYTKNSYFVIFLLSISYNFSIEFIRVNPIIFFDLTMNQIVYILCLLLILVRLKLATKFS